MTAIQPIRNTLSSSLERVIQLARSWACQLFGALIFSALVAALNPVLALPLGDAPIAGAAAVIDGDTLDIAGERVRLQGIDAPEMAQTCKSAAGTDWACGREAQKKLIDLTQGQTVACDRKGQDKYARTLAVCFVEGEDINAILVKAGLARAFVKYSQDYVVEEADARSTGAGLWQGDSVAPWDFRNKRWQAAETAAPSGCAIKGNISNNGHIYHVPWSTWYDKVRIETGRGERWFCTEAEAAAAGWRAAEQR
ncbi:MAG: thermonuclease family protein [Hyphomicrobium sp.]